MSKRWMEFVANPPLMPANAKSCPWAHVNPNPCNCGTPSKYDRLLHRFSFGSNIQKRKGKRPAGERGACQREEASCCRSVPAQPAHYYQHCIYDDRRSKHTTSKG
eukprot:1975999-Rhodomonas_salina.2